MNDKNSIVNDIKGVSQEFLELSQSILNKKVVEYQSKIESDVNPLLNIQKPKIMVYGIYNSGKSTLINALLREEKAEMASRPMTDSISEYDNGNYILIDAPGVDAPIEHEMVTNAHLNKCHVILFVMSSKGGFESRENYTRLLELIEKNIPFIIVLNERTQGANANATQAEKDAIKLQHIQNINGAKEKIIKNLVKISNNPAITSKYEVVNLDALKALTSVKKNIPKLYELSDVGNLEQRLEEILYSNDLIRQLFMQPILNLKNIVINAEQDIFLKYSISESGNYQEMFRIIQLKKDNLLNELKFLITENILREKGSFSSAIRNNNPSALESYVDDLSRSFEQELDTKIREFLTYIESNFEKINNISLSLDIKHQVSVDGAMGGIDYNVNASQFDELAETLAQNYQNASPVVEETGLMEGIAKDAALVLPVLLTPAPLKMPVIAIAAGVKVFEKLFSDNSKQQEEEFRKLQAQNELFNRAQEERAAEQMRIEQEVTQASERFAYKIEKSLYLYCVERLNELVSNVLKSIQALEKMQEEQKVQCDKEILMIKQIENKLLKLEKEIL